jgi:two-component system chemotaxis response regulator CheY
MARILIIDDDSFLRQLLRIHLSGDGHAVSEAAEASEAIRLVLKSDFDLVITDFNMPFMDGIELATAIRGDPKTHHIPLIMLTANTTDDVSKRAHDLGVRVLNKPITVELVKDAVKEVLAAR